MMSVQQPYDSLAQVYDKLQQDYDAAAWAKYLAMLDQRFNLRRESGDGKDGAPLLLDLGCGTGAICLEMAQLGYDPIGIDASAVMLEQARLRWPNAESAGPGGEALFRPLFLQQDISRFELYGTVDLIICTLDTINHLTRADDIRRMLHRCSNYLNPGGLLIFDLASEYHLAHTLGNQVFYQDHADYTMLWQNRYAPRSRISRSELTLFVRREDDLYQRHDVLIKEKYYSHAMVLDWLSDLPMSCLACYNPLVMRRATEKVQRHFYIVRRLADHVAE